MCNGGHDPKVVAATPLPYYTPPAPPALSQQSWYNPSTWSGQTWAAVSLGALIAVRVVADVATAGVGTPALAALDAAAASADTADVAVTAAADSAEIASEATDAAAGASEGATDAANAGADEASVARGGVYTLRDEAGAVVRTGRTSNLAAREAAHANDPVLGDFRFNVEYRTDVYAEQRGLEQVLYDRYPEAMQVNGGFNKIGAISPSNPNILSYTQAAQDFLSRGAP